MFISKYNYTDDNALIEYAAGLSSREGELKDKLLHWEFGPLMNMSYQVDAANYLFSSERVPFHWDGAFYKEPSLLLFYCMDSNGVDGETIFSNTEKIWDSLTAEEKEKALKIELTYKTEKKAHYGGEIKVKLVQTHPKTGKNILRLAEKVDTKLNPVSVEASGIDGALEFFESLTKKLYEKEFLYAHKWEKGDLLICDNFTYLHGRNALNGNLQRSFKRIQVL